MYEKMSLTALCVIFPKLCAIFIYGETSNRKFKELIHASYNRFQNVIPETTEG
jgi:hypothetical protein